MSVTCGASQLHSAKCQTSARYTSANFILVLCLMPLLLCACSEKVQQIQADITPRVKTTRVEAGGELRSRSLVGELQAAEVWNLAFPIQGRVTQLLVNEGDKVKKGQILATLDPMVYELKLRNAQAALESSRSERNEKFDALAAQSRLKEKGYMTGPMLEKFRVDLAASETRLANSESAVALARRELDYTSLRAPGDGVISGRFIEAFSDVNAGQPVMRLDGAAGLRVAIRVPDKLMSGFTLGSAVKVQVAERILDGQLSRIDARASSGDSFPCYISLRGDTTGLRPGVTASVHFSLKPAINNSSTATETTTQKMMQLPLQAIVPGNSPGQGFAFLFDNKTNQVKRVVVRIKAVNDANVEIDSGLQAGDEVVVAGVAFLSDGQLVKPIVKANKGANQF